MCRVLSNEHLAIGFSRPLPDAAGAGSVLRPRRQRLVATARRVGGLGNERLSSQLTADEAACASYDEASDLVGLSRYLVDAGLIADELNRVIDLPALDEIPEVVVVPNRVRIPHHLVAIR
jgi:hypothetical protein